MCCFEREKAVSYTHLDVYKRQVECGVKTSERYLTKRLALSLSLLAHGPGGVLYLCIGGTHDLSFLLCFIAFHMEVLVYRIMLKRVARNFVEF